jgi:hypothetical protein
LCFSKNKSFLCWSLISIQVHWSLNCLMFLIRQVSSQGVRAKDDSGFGKRFCNFWSKVVGKGNEEMFINYFNNNNLSIMHHGKWGKKTIKRHCSFILLFISCDL